MCQPHKLIHNYLWLTDIRKMTGTLQEQPSDLPSVLRRRGFCFLYTRRPFLLLMDLPCHLHCGDGAPASPVSSAGVIECWMPSPLNCLASSDATCSPTVWQGENKASSDFYKQLMALGLDLTFEGIASGCKLALDESWETVSDQAVSKLPFVKTRWHWRTFTGC